uniref:Uncharacterized protein n=1 Tax=Strix occidentalis caurina TaxID=311401 RepID=A0A8D0G117_STROC
MPPLPGCPSSLPHPAHQPLPANQRAARVTLANHDAPLSRAAGRRQAPRPLSAPTNPRRPSLPHRPITALPPRCANPSRAPAQPLTNRAGRYRPSCLTCRAEGRGRGGVAMVRAFLLLALGGRDPPGPAPPGTPRQRLRRKEQLMAVARQVVSQCRLLQSSSGRPSSPQLPQLPDEPISLQDAPGGLFRLPPGDPFPEGVTVAWLSFLALAFALVCDPQENLALAEITLRRLAPRLHTSLRLLGPGADVLLRARGGCSRSGLIRAGCGEAAWGGPGGAPLGLGGRSGSGGVRAGSGPSCRSRRR